MSRGHGPGTGLPTPEAMASGTLDPIPKFPLDSHYRFPVDPVVSQFEEAAVALHFMHYKNVVATETRVQIAISKQKPSDLFARKWLRASATTCRQTAS